MKKVYSTLANRAELDKYYSSVKTPYYFNFNKTMLFDKQYYFDTHHLNQAGAEKFDKMMIDTLKKYKVIL